MLWIRDHTHQSAVFAGTMPTMAMVLLTTKRPIVNHPHYETAGLRSEVTHTLYYIIIRARIVIIIICRNRTKQVYSIFSRKPATEIHSILHGMGVDYVISEDGWCGKYRDKPGQL